MEKEVLRMERICFNENSIEVVRDGNFHVFESEIVGLVGKNHAGKSTLMGAATGEYPCQSGEIWIGEHRKKIMSIEQARKEGIFLIKDESSLINEFTIQEMMKLNFAFVQKRVKYAHYIKTYREMLRLLEIQSDYDTLIQNLNFHQQVLIEIAQALSCDVKILVLDNVVSLLSNNARIQMQRIFQILRLRGISILLIENQPDCIKGYLSRLCIMRKGRVVAELGKEELDDDLILSLIEGEKFIPNPGKLQILNQVDCTKKVLEFQRVCTEDCTISGLDFILYGNETLGIWNRNRHSGKAILDILEGNSEVSSGKILVNGRKFQNQTADSRMLHKVLTVPEEDELFSNMDLGENISLSALKKNAYGGILKKEGELRYLVHDLCGEYMMDEGYRLFPNQMIPGSVLIKKKVSLCRAIAAGADVIVYNNPDLKMDVREKEIFRQDILKTQKKKIGQIIISSQLDSLYPVCNRILQVEKGKIVGEIQV